MRIQNLCVVPLWFFSTLNIWLYQGLSQTPKLSRLSSNSQLHSGISSPVLTGGRHWVSFLLSPHVNPKGMKKLFSERNVCCIQLWKFSHIRRNQWRVPLSSAEHGSWKRSRGKHPVFLQEDEGTRTLGFQTRAPFWGIVMHNLSCWQNDEVFCICEFMTSNRWR